MTQSVLIFEWAKNHITYILYGVVGVVVVIGLIVGWSSWQRQHREKAAEALHQALKLMDASAEEPSEADTAKAIEHLQAITRDYSRTPAATQAHWHLGHLYLARGEAKTALAAYERARHGFSREQQLRTVLATLSVGYAQEATDACDQAIASYEAVQQSSVYWIHGEAYLGMGRCYERRSATDKAIAIYEQALADSRVIGLTQQTISEHLKRLQPDTVAPTVTESEQQTTPATASPDGNAGDIDPGEEDKAASSTSPKTD